MMFKQPDQISVINLEAVLMPNGEIICAGKTIGWFDKLGEFCSPKVAKK